MDCRNVKELLPAYLDGDLPAAQMRRLEQALQGCPECAEELAALKLLDQAAANLPQVTPSEGFDDAFWARMQDVQRAERREPVKAAWWRELLVPLGLFAGAAAALVLAFSFTGEPGDGGVDRDLAVDVAERLELLKDLPVVENLEALEVMTSDDDIDLMLELEEVLTEETQERGGQ